MREFSLALKAYDSYGGHSTLSLIPEFFLLDAPDFGAAISELSLTFCLTTTSPPKKTLEQSYAQHQSYLSSLPKIVFRRQKGQMTITVASDLMDSKDWVPSRLVSLPLFTRGIDEALSALALMKNKLKATDSFDLSGFLAHCESAKKRIPTSEEKLQLLVEQLKAARKAKFDAMSPWEKLRIDWEEFHPNARSILDDPFFWDTSNDFSPNGNDTGADLLEEYRDWLKRHKDGKPIEFLERLTKRWGYSETSQMDDETRNEAHIALAFAEIKLRGSCEENVKNLAKLAIERQRSIAEASVGWDFRDERIRTLITIQVKLQTSK